MSLLWHRSCQSRMAVLLLLFLAVAPWAGALEGPLVTLGDPSAPETSVCEALRAHGLPIGLLPRGAREFRIDGEGRFEVRLARACSARFEGEMRYEANVTGTLSYGQIGGLSGVTAQELFLWFPVTGIRVDDPSSGLIFFDVGVVRKQLPLSLFEIPPDCDIAVPPAADLFKDGEIAVPVEKSKSGKVKYETDRKMKQMEGNSATITGGEAPSRPCSINWFVLCSASLLH